MSWNIVKGVKPKNRLFGEWIRTLTYKGRGLSNKTRKVKVEGYTIGTGRMPKKLS